MQYKNEWKIYMIRNATNVWYEWMKKWIIDNAMYTRMNVHGRMMVKEWTFKVNKDNVNKYILMLMFFKKSVILCLNKQDKKKCHSV